MNIFGLFFSFLIPGIVLGMLITGAILDDKKAKGSKQVKNTYKERSVSAQANKLFVYSMSEDIAPKPKLKLINGEENRKKLFICSVDGNKAA